MGTLWDKGYSLDNLVERFTVGNDFELDRHLLVADCIASMAHARTIERAGAISSDDADQLVAELVAIAQEAESGAVDIPRELEDGHTVIESRLTERLGEAGKRIHTGRSRNDQVIAAERLYARQALWQVQDAASELVMVLLECAGKHERTPMAGRTHMQIAMPSTFGLWAASVAEAIVDDLELTVTARRHCDRSPLGAAASYGVPLDLDRQFTANLLGFERVQNNVLAVNNSRGKVEAIVLDSLEAIMLTLSKFAADLILFSLPEFGYVELPVELCSGSSIMP
ncbi:MAG: lyase family protein, partial [Spirochaetia bacterium]